MSNHPEEKTGLSDFFSVLSEEKGKAKKKFEERIDDPATGISSLFNKLNYALTEVQKPTLHPEDLSEEKILTSDDQKKIAVFSNLVHSFDSEEEIPEEIEIKIEESLPELIVEPLMDREYIVQSEEPPKEIVKTDSIISEIVNTLDEMGGRTEVKKEIDQITALRRDFDKFRTLIQRDISKREMSGAGSGEVRFEFLDDVDRDSVKVDGKFLKYQSSTGKFIGADAAGGTQNLFSTLSVSGQSDVVADSTTDTLTLVAGTKVTLTTDASADSITITAAGSTNEEIQDVVGAMFSSNTETGITATYVDGDGTLDLVVGTLNQDTTGNAATATALETGRTIGMTGDVVWTSASFDGSGNVTGTAAIQANSVALGTDTTGNYVATIAGTSNEIEVSGSGSETAGVTIGLPDNVTIGGNLTVTGNYTVNGTTTTIATTNTLLEDNLIELNTGASTNANDSGILIERGSTGNNAIIMWDESADKFQVGTTTATASDTGNLTVTTGILVANIEGNVTGDVTGNASTATTLESARTIHGVSFNGSANIDLTEEIQDTVGAMFGSNTETGIAVTYVDGDGTIDLVVGTLNQDTTGNAATATALETARTIGGTSFNGTANIAVALAATATALATARTIGGTSFDGTANIAVALAATSTALATARTIHGVSFDGTANIDLTEVVQDTVGAMFSSNTETGITVTYVDGDGTIDLVVGTLNQDTSGTAAIATTVTITDNESTNESNAIIFTAGGDVDGGNLGLESDGTLTYNPSTGKITATGFVGTLTGNVTGDVTGSSGSTTGNAATATALATARTIGGTSFDGTANIAVTLAATATALATSRTIGMTGDVVWTSPSFDGSGNVTAAATIQANSVDGTMIALGSDAAGDVMYYNGTNYIRLAKGSDDEVLTLASGVPSWAAAGGTSDESIQDVVGAMFTSNTETGIAATYQDGDGTIDLVVGTLNQNTTGNAATATALETARTIGGTSFDGTANIAVALAATATALASARTIGGVSFDGTGNINLPGVNAAGNQNTSGTAAIATAVTITDNESTDESNAIIFTAGGDVDGGNLGLESDGTLTYNPNTGKITATGFVGTLTGNVTGNTSGSSGSTTGNAATATALATARTIGGTSFDGTANIAVALATLATTVTITDNESTNESNALIFTAGGDVDGGNLGLESDGTLTYNPSSGTVTSTIFSGALSGNATTATALATGRTIGMTGDVVWTSASFTGSGNVTGAATIQSGAVETGMIAADAITAAKIADDVLNSEHYAAGSIDREHLAADIVDGTKIADDSINSEHYAADSIDAEHYAAGSVDATALGADCVTAAKIGDNVLNSEHYAAGSIDAEHIANDVINSQHYAADSIDEEHIANDAIGSAELKSLSTLLIKNSSGSTLKTIHGAGA